MSIIQTPKDTKVSVERTQNMCSDCHGPVLIVNGHTYVLHSVLCRFRRRYRVYTDSR